MWSHPAIGGRRATWNRSWRSFVPHTVSQLNTSSYNVPLTVYAPSLPPSFPHSLTHSLSLSLFTASIAVPTLSDVIEAACPYFAPPASPAHSKLALTVLRWSRIVCRHSDDTKDLMIKCQASSEACSVLAVEMYMYMYMYMLLVYTCIYMYMYMTLYLYSQNLKIFFLT